MERDDHGAVLVQSRHCDLDAVDHRDVRVIIGQAKRGRLPDAARAASEPSSLLSTVTEASSQPAFLALCALATVSFAAM